MTAFQQIIKALKGFDYPKQPDSYTGTSKRWFTYNYSDDFGAAFADDKPQEHIVTVQIHFFMPLNEDFISIKNRIRKALIDAEFTSPDITVLNEKNNNIRHLIYECDIEESEE